jgi:thymidylate synthase (FAD)
MEVHLRHFTPLDVLVEGIRTCWDSGDLSDSGYPKIEHPSAISKDWVLGNKDKKLIQAVIKKNHTSTLEHISYNFKIEGISRLVLQELARHRIASPSVKSTRYTLKELENEEEFNCISPEDFDRASKYINWSGDSLVDKFSMQALENLRDAIASGISNDVAKYCLPECYKVDLVWTINLRSLQNFLALRTNPAAHFEIRELAYKIYNALPEGHKFIVDNCVFND